VRRLSLVAAVAALAATAATAATSYPETIPLPNGFQPEGIAIATGTTFYVGSIPTGAVYAGDVRTGEGAIRVKGRTGRSAIGLKVDRGRLWVSGGATGKAFVYDARSGALLRTIQLATGGGDTFVNDVTVTKTAAYFTDSSRPVLYKVTIVANGAPGKASTIRLGGSYEHLGGFNLNGIAATANGKTLLAVQSANGRLYAIDAATGRARTVNVGAALENGDGLLLRGRTLYAVQNRLNQIAVVRLAPGLDRGSATRTIKDADFDVPTTVAALGNRLYAVNARFGTAGGSDAAYDVVQVRG
jgi:sugar lactone lactonase YvrE